MNCEIVYQGSTGTVDGTSCSSPIFASVIALLNDELVAANKSSLGFLNPWLYSTAASAFTDITSGTNPGCGTNGFSAVSGWDVSDTRLVCKLFSHLPHSLLLVLAPPTMPRSARLPVLPET